MKGLVFEKIKYEPETGVFTWAADIGNQWAGSQAGSIQKKGYRQIELGEGRYQAHRLAWFLMTGAWPTRQIDHINGIKDDNRWCNLRLATNAQNKRNSVRRADNTTGFKCVSRQQDKWLALITIPASRKRTSCGRFADAVTAAACANVHMAYYYGEFCRLNPMPMEWPHD